MLQSCYLLWHTALTALEYTLPQGRCKLKSHLAQMTPRFKLWWTRFHTKNCSRTSLPQIYTTTLMYCFWSLRYFPACTVWYCLLNSSMPKRSIVNPRELQSCQYWISPSWLSFASFEGKQWNPPQPPGYQWSRSREGPGSGSRIASSCSCGRSRRQSRVMTVGYRLRILVYQWTHQQGRNRHSCYLRREQWQLVWTSWCYL